MYNIIFMKDYKWFSCGDIIAKTRTKIGAKIKFKKAVQKFDRKLSLLGAKLLEKDKDSAFICINDVYYKIYIEKVKPIEEVIV